MLDKELSKRFFLKQLLLYSLYDLFLFMWLSLAECM